MSCDPGLCAYSPGPVTWPCLSTCGLLPDDVALQHKVSIRTDNGSTYYVETYPAFALPCDAQMLQAL